MKIEFVNPPRTFIDRSEIAPPLGLLRLAEVGRCAGSSVDISDLNLLFHLDERLAVSDHFYIYATDFLLNKKADVYCFTSMAVDSHIALHLARLLKKERPEVVTVVGGTHFSSIADPVIDRFPWIDFVVIGEGENFVRDLPKLISENRSAKVVKGSPLIGGSTGDLPFDLLDLNQYFAVNPNRCLDFESGRGCRFKCAFCYSPQHYNGFRNFSIDRTIAGLERAHNLGFRNVFFVEDNFLNDPARALDFCKEFERSRCDLSWQAYVTFPQLNSEIISWMARAGCSAVFAGIDAVGTESRRIHKKSFVRDTSVLECRIRECVDNGIIPTCAFLLSPPSYPGGSDMDETLHFALAARNAGAKVRLNTLTLYNRTGTYLANTSVPEYDEFKVRLTLDVPEVVEENFYALENPELFPFHSRYVDGDVWHDFISLTHCLYTVVDAFPETLWQLWAGQGVSPTEIARKMLDNTGSLLDIPKSARRDAEMLAAVEVLESLATREKQLQPVLELESSRFLVFN
ncbi:MAG: B12-binding domain-containing radical SAM protein [Acidobacteria bacterium]|nr:B12-binding domain-containing radical SAM protein [Acidobacteriota bacterium]